MNGSTSNVFYFEKETNNLKVHRIILCLFFVQLARHVFINSNPII